MKPVTEVGHLIKIPFKDPLVKSYYDYYYNGLCSYEYLQKTIHKLEDERIQFLREQGMPEEQAIDEAIDSIYDIDVQLYDNQTQQFIKSFDLPF